MPGLSPGRCAATAWGSTAPFTLRGVLSAEDTTRRGWPERGRLMHREAEKYPGAMAAVIGLTPEN